MLTRGKRKRVEHQASTLRGIFPIPRDVLNILKRMWSPLDWFMLCEAFGCHADEPTSGALLLECAIEENHERVVEWLLKSLSSMQISLAALRRNPRFVNLAAFNGNLNVLKLLKRYKFNASWYEAPNHAASGRGDIECIDYLVTEFGCLLTMLCCKGRYSLLVYAQNHGVYLRWRLELAYAIHNDWMNSVEFIRNLAAWAFTDVFHYMWVLKFDMTVWNNHDTFCRAIFKCRVLITTNDLLVLSTNQRAWLYKAIEEHGDFFLTPGAKDYLRNNDWDQWGGFMYPLP